MKRENMKITKRNMVRKHIEFSNKNFLQIVIA